jgi:DNA polymerase III delta prime subunit
MSRMIGILMCLVSIIWGYNEHQAGTVSFGPLTAFLGGAAVFVATFDATETLLRKLVSKSTSEEERSASDAHNRQAMLNRVRDFWVKGVLESSLHEEARIDLGLEEQRDAVAERPWDVILRTPDRPDCVLPRGTKISNVFERVGRSLLILGEPGSGKTTTLLELAREMIDRAEKDPSEKIPVVFNLSSWTDPKQTIAAWLAEEMRDNYRIQKKIAEAWIENDSILPLLDGLDEAAPERRAACVDAINSYLDEHSGRAAICCRKKDYDDLGGKLELQNAILLQPLTPEQIDSYLEKLSPDLGSLREALRSDRELQEFAKTPLILSIMTLAYRGISAESLRSFGSTEERRGHLFKTYVDQMFERTTRIDPKLYPKEKTIRWLSWLAGKMKENNQTVLLIERMQPSWFDTEAQQRLYSISVRRSVVISGGLLFCLSVGLVGGLIGGSIGGQTGELVLIYGQIFWVLVGLIVGLNFGLTIWFLLKYMQELSEIKTAEILNWSWKTGRERLSYHKLICDMIVGLVVGLLFGKSFGLCFGPIDLLAFGLIFVLLRLLISGMSVAKMERTTVPNQGILQSAKNAAIVGLVGGLICWLLGLFLYCYVC